MPTLVEYSVMVPGRAEVVGQTGAKSIYRAHALRTAGIAIDKSLAAVLDKEENFNFTP